MSQADLTEQVLAKVQRKDARNALRSWLKTHSAKMIPENWTGKGFTTAQLLGAQLLGYRSNPLVVILKINPAGGGSREYNAHLRAVKDSPHFARDHMAKLVAWTPVQEVGSIFLQSPAGGGLEETIQLDKALQTYRAPEKLCRDITRSLLGEWNTGSDVTVRTEPLGAVIATALGKRLAQMGTITAWAGRHPGLQHDPRPWINTAPVRLVNPFALIGTDSWGGAMKVNLWHGKTHGDLHPGNLLINRQGSHCLIDLSRYNPQGILGWDQTYLTLTTVAGVLPDLPPRGGRALSDWCLEPTEAIDVEGLPAHLQQMLVGVDRAGIEWAQEHHNVSGWRRQRLICLMVIALVLTGRRALLSEESRSWFFWLAASAATRLAEQIPDFPRPGDAIAPPASLFATAPPPDDGLPSATVVNLDQRRRNRQPPSAQATDPTTAEAEYWTQLAAELNSTVFSAPNPAAMAARTNRLRLLLPMAPTSSGGDLARYLGDLAGALDAAIRPGTSPTERHAAVEHADRLRAWILGLLA